ncbi:MAG: hypothetical protein HYS20_09430 [Rhodocyclales bacterium]|nr:hypothetical protein [Rhodocyclales bacterium]
MSPRAHALKAGTLRREIASIAARMMAEDGISDFGFAKRKAARQLGVTESESLPTNAEIEAELRAWQALYQDEEQDERIYEMRVAAVGIMEMLEQFHPYLTGGALDGTAGRYSEVEIEIYPESAKEVEIFFLNQSLAYEHREPRRAMAHPPEAILCFDWDDVPVRLAIFDQNAERAGRRATERARLQAVEALLENSQRASE